MAEATHQSFVSYVRETKELFELYSNLSNLYSLAGKRGQAHDKGAFRPPSLAGHASEFYSSLRELRDAVASSLEWEDVDGVDADFVKASEALACFGGCERTKGCMRVHDIWETAAVGDLSRGSLPVGPEKSILESTLLSGGVAHAKFAQGPAKGLRHTLLQLKCDQGERERSAARLCLEWREGRSPSYLLIHTSEGELLQDYAGKVVSEGEGLLRPCSGCHPGGALRFGSFGAVLEVYFLSSLASCNCLKTNCLQTCAENDRGVGRHPRLGRRRQTRGHSRAQVRSFRSCPNLRCLFHRTPISW